MGSVSYNQMLEVVLNEYPGQHWHERVGKMPERQVIAIYHKIMMKRADLERHEHFVGLMNALDGQVVKLEWPKQEQAHQIDMFEWAAKEGIDIYGREK